MVARCVGGTSIEDASSVASILRELFKELVVVWLSCEMGWDGREGNERGLSYRARFASTFRH